MNWEKIKNATTREELEDLGLRAYNDQLMLFPGTWYKKIPVGFMVTCIDGRKMPWATEGPGRCDDDTRFGFLAYGVEVTRNLIQCDTCGKDLRTPLTTKTATCVRCLILAKHELETL